MNRTRTFLTATAENLTSPVSYLACSKCGIEFPNRKPFFRNKKSPWYGDWCCFCVWESLVSKAALTTSPDIPPAEGEIKCAICGRNFRNHPHNFDLVSGYVHPSGESPCCRICQGNERKAYFKEAMTNRHLDIAELEAIRIAEASNQSAEADCLRTKREARLTALHTKEEELLSARQHLREIEEFNHNTGIHLTLREWDAFKKLSPEEAEKFLDGKKQ
jgi:hypothetical protein